MSNTAITALGPYDGPTSFREQQELASALARSNMLPQAYWGKPGNVMALLLTARGLDTPVMATINHLTVMPLKDPSGKVYGYNMADPEGRLTQALMERAGYRMDPVVHTDEEIRAHLVFPEREQREPVEVDYTLVEAQRKGLVSSNKNWGKAPKDMLWWRWWTKANKMYCPHLTMGVTGGEWMHEPDEPAAPTKLDPDVEKALRAFDEADTVEKLMEAGYAAEAVMDLPASLEDPKLILRRVFMDILKAAQERAEAEAAQQAAEHGDDAPEPQEGQPEQAPPAGAEPAAPEEAPGRLECGCTTAQVIAQGAHRIGCPENPDTSPAADTGADPHEQGDDTADAAEQPSSPPERP
ncbi:hypothetical protein ACQEVF_57545 [Nonomuraea polychroma]|uniref:hypothetical protein n=1 Tax=Nonomuraea polychroma TaxID=46176 RepID=UPI003D8A9D86